MKHHFKEQVKESFMNFQFLIIVLGTIISLIFGIIFTSEILLYIAAIGILLILLYLIGFCSGLIRRKNVAKVRNGQIKYEPYTIDIKQFIEECQFGLFYSIIRINNQIYEVETQPDKVNSTNYDHFTCYINDQEIIGLDNFLNYKFDGLHSLKELDTIEFLEYNAADPRRYFIDHTI